MSKNSEFADLEIDIDKETQERSVRMFLDKHLSPASLSMINEKKPIKNQLFKLLLNEQILVALKNYVEYHKDIANED